MRLSKNSTFADLLNHPRAEHAWIVRNGTHAPDVVARVIMVRKRGSMFVGVNDYATPKSGAVGKCDYGNVWRALVGQCVDGVEIGMGRSIDGRPTLDQLCNERGWLWIAP